MMMIVLVMLMIIMMRVIVYIMQSFQQLDILTVCVEEPCCDTQRQTKSKNTDFYL